MFYFCLLMFLLLMPIIILVSVYFKRFMIIRINGVSMMSTLKHGQFFILDKMSKEPIVNNIYILYPNGSTTPVIKRLITYLPSGSCWFEGDNKDDSVDSRFYGFLSKEDIFGEVITFRESLKRFFFIY